MQIKLLNEEGEEIPGCMWQVMRARLTPAFVQVGGMATTPSDRLQRRMAKQTPICYACIQSRLDMSPLKNLQLDCLRDSKTQEIIYPDEMQKKCQVWADSPRARLG